MALRQRTRVRAQSGAKGGVVAPVARFLRGDSGAASVEFMVVIIPLLTIFLSIVELGFYMMRSVMLSRGVDIAMREVRLGTMPLGTEVTQDGTVLIGKPLKRTICENSFFLPDCENAVQIEMRPLGAIASFGSGNTDCVDRTQPVNPVNTYDQGGRSEVMYVRVCFVVDPLFPGVAFFSQLPAQVGGGYAILSETAFMNEPS
ncbi:MAG: TadE/TadG family type IV pilus assembly protein [Pseudomonadota bacterium]